MSKDALSISFSVADESKEIVKMIVIAYRANGSVVTWDTGVTAEEAKKMCAQFISWIDTCIGREIERKAQTEG